MKKLISILVAIVLLTSCSKQEDECNIGIYLIKDTKEELIDVVPCGTDLSLYCDGLTTEKRCLVDGPMIYVAREIK